MLNDVSSTKFEAFGHIRCKNISHLLLTCFAEANKSQQEQIDAQKQQIEELKKQEHYLQRGADGVERRNERIWFDLDLMWFGVLEVAVSQLHVAGTAFDLFDV